MERVGELFSPDFNLLLHDITSTYGLGKLTTSFEGQAKANPQAKRGYMSGGFAIALVSC